MSNTTPDTPSPDTERGNTNIDGMDALDGMADAGLILDAIGLARCNSAISGMEALTNILFQLDIDKDCTGGIQANARTTGGLIQALAVCTEFLNGHLNGGLTHFHAANINADHPDYADLLGLHNRVSKGGTS